MARENSCPKLSGEPGMGSPEKELRYTLVQEEAYFALAAT